MTVIKLRELKGVGKWDWVTRGGEIDSIYFEIIGDTNEIGGFHNLRIWLHLYACVLTETPTEQYDEYFIFEIRELDDGGIALSYGSSYGPQGPIETDYDELRQAIERFFAELFPKLDERSSAEEKEDAFAFMEAMDLPYDVRELYEDVTGSDG